MSRCLGQVLMKANTLGAKSQRGAHEHVKMAMLPLHRLPFYSRWTLSNVSIACKAAQAHVFRQSGQCFHCFLAYVHVDSAKNSCTYLINVEPHCLQ